MSRPTRHPASRRSSTASSLARTLEEEEEDEEEVMLPPGGKGKGREMDMAGEMFGRGYNLNSTRSPPLHHPTPTPHHTHHHAGPHNQTSPSSSFTSTRYAPSPSPSAHLNALDRRRRGSSPSSSASSGSGWEGPDGERRRSTLVPVPGQYTAVEDSKDGGEGGNEKEGMRFEKVEGFVSPKSGMRRLEEEGRGGRVLGFEVGGGDGNRAITLPIPAPSPSRTSPPRRSSLTHSLRLYNLPAPTFSAELGSSPPLTASTSPHNLPRSTTSEQTDPFNNPFLINSPPYHRPHINSAPPTPVAASVIHPSAFIHTHHPRRGSLTPLGLNLISPAPPSPQVQDYVRRESATLGWGVSPAGSPLRRKSLTPSVSTMAMISPTRLTATGSIARGIIEGEVSSPVEGSGVGYMGGTRRETLRPTVSEGGRGEGEVPHSFGEKSGKRLQEGLVITPPGGSGISPALLSALSAGIANGRRASQPTIQYTPATAWPSTAASPEMEQQVGEEGVEVEGTKEQGFAFGRQDASGSIRKNSQEALSPRSEVPSLPGSSNSLKFPSGEGLSTSAESEAAEAERQRIAFLAATYGSRPRPSVGTLSTRRTSTMRDTPGGFLMGNEGYRRGSPGIPGYEGADSGLSGSVKGPVVGPAEDGTGEGRRGSLPMTIPAARSMRRPTSLAVGRTSADDEVHEHDDFADEASPPSPAGGSFSKQPSGSQERPPTPPRQRQALSRPLPPLLPLSDPGPRLLPSTLALHRASHLLQSRNLASEPMPAPLPPSLHPPEPVNVSDFDIDFILSGAQSAVAAPSSLGSVGPQSPSTTVVPTSKRSGPPPDISRGSTTTLKLGAGGEDEDTFAKFVGEFDDEYDDRRGEWTFKQCPSARDPAPGPSSKHKSRALTELAEWDSHGAGKYFIYPSGEITSGQSGRTWRVKRLAGREYEVESVEMQPPTVSVQSAKTKVVYTLASKQIHSELGGVKVPASAHAYTPSHHNVFGRRRVDSHDSSTAAGKVSEIFSRSLPFHIADHHRMSSVQHDISASPVDSYHFDNSLNQTPNGQSRGRSDKREKVAFVTQKASSRSRDNSPGEHDRDKKKERASIGDKIKRTWFAGINRTGGLVEDRRNDKEKEKEKEKDKEKDKSQSHSWSGGSSASSVWSQGSDSSGDRHGIRPSSSAKGGLDTGYQPPWLLLSDHVPPAKKSGKEERARVNSESGITAAAELARFGVEEESHGPVGWKEGKAWAAVPDEAVAMVLPLQTTPNLSRDSNDAQRTASGGASKRSLEIPSFFTDAPPRSLLVYYVPFNSNSSNSADPHRDAVRRFSTGKLLRKIGSRDKLSGHSLSHDNSPADPNTACLIHPLPFRSFRIVACVVEPDDLRCEPQLPSWPAWEEPGSASARGADSPALESDFSDSPKDGSQQNRFPTVIAVCHSRSQGVEFVMEGLDRLGLCKGQSAWGPTGYEEWRGSGLSEEGRALLDILWAGCVGVMGLHGK